jgi:8-amino-7-oxononanoate synthase
VGARGRYGGGAAEELGLTFDNLLLVGGLGPGLGAAGGFVAGLAGLIDYLGVAARRAATSSLPPDAVGAALAGLELVRSDEGRRLRARVGELGARLREGLARLGFQLQKGDGEVVAVAVGGELRTLLSCRRLLDQGVYVPVLLPPAVPRDEGLLQVSLTALHTDADLEALLDAFAALSRYWSERSGKLGGRLRYAGDLLRSARRPLA